MKFIVTHSYFQIMKLMACKDGIYSLALNRKKHVAKPCLEQGCQNANPSLRTTPPITLLHATPLPVPPFAQMSNGKNKMSAS